MGDIDRRTFVRGAAGSALALPALEAGLTLSGGDDEEARAAESSDQGPDEPLFYIVCFTGSATGASGQYDVDHHVDCVPDGPNATGEDYPLTDPGLQPLDQDLDVHGREGTSKAKEYVSLLSGLSMPVATGPNDTPPGSRVGYDSDRKFHKYQIPPLLTGVSSEKANRERDLLKVGTSSDQIVADRWNQSRTFAGRVQADVYGKYPGLRPWDTALSTVERGGNVDIIEPHIDPREAFKQWIGNDSTGTGPTRRELLMGSSDKSVLDSVLEGFNRMKDDASLPRRDRKRLERHADKVRKLEKDIDQLKQRAVCDGGFPDGIWGQRSNRNQQTGVNNGWMHEDLRAELMADLMVRSMACGQTNVGTLCYSLEGSRMNIRYLGSQSKQGGIHGTAHSDSYSVLSPQWVINWHVDQWVKLLKRLAEEPAPPPHDGDSMLDHAAVVLLFESGAEKNGSWRKNHTTDNMVALIGGRGGTGDERLTGNVHVDAGNDSHPCTAQMTAMEALGIRQNRFGEVPWESHDELFESV